MRTLLLGIFLAGLAFGQAGTPDCQFTARFTTATPGTAGNGLFNNKTTRCTSWRLTYWTNGASGVSVTLQGGTDVAGVAGSFSSLTATQGTSNPATGTTQGTIAAAPDFYPWIRVNPTTFTGTSQTMAVTVYGWKAPDTGPTATSGGGATSNVNIAQYGGATAAYGQAAMAASIPVVIASNQTSFPVTIAAGSAVIGHVITDSGSTTAATQATASNLNAQVVGAVASAGSNAGNPVKIGGPFNTTQPTVANGQIVDAQLSARGSQLVTPGVEGFPVTIAANSAVNVAQWAGTTAGNGGTAGYPGVGGVVPSAGTNTGVNPVKIGGPFNTTQPTVTNGQMVDGQFSARGSFLVTPGVEGFAVTPAANSAINLAQLGGTTITPDPCTFRAKTIAFINLTAGATIITGTASNKTYICGVQLVAAAATNVAIVEGTGTVCATSTVQLFGGATAATGWNFAANGGLTFGGGNATIAVTTVNANNTCVLVSAANQISGSVTYVTAP